jgi:hypothetical protein
MPSNGTGDATLARRQKVKSAASGQHSQQAQSSRRQPPVLLFERADASLYTSLTTLPQKAGVAANLLARLCGKELADNALDAADMAGRPGAVTVRIKAGNLTVTDQGTGIADATPEKLAHIFSVARPMLSSKLLRRPSRGAVGNGLRVCLGYLTATSGCLIVETGALRVELDPQVDGRSRIASVTAIKPITGVRLTAIAGNIPFTPDDLTWAEDAIELASQSGRPAFTGKPSPHWLDHNHFRVLLQSAGQLSVRAFLAQFDGLSGSKIQSEIAARFLRRTIDTLAASEAAQLLTACQGAARVPKAKTLCPLGRDAVIATGYAIAEGTVIEGAHPPRAHLPFLVEAWVDAFPPEEREQTVSGALYMNRTRALTPFTGHAWHGRLDLTVSNTSVACMVPAGPRYEVTINITSPTFRLLSDGKTPDCRPFRSAMAEVVDKAAKQAGRDIAQAMSSEQKRFEARKRAEFREAEQEQRLSDREARQARQERLAAEKAERDRERQERPDIREAVIQLLPGAIKRAEASGYLFNTRHLVYDIREKVRQLTGKELTQSYFDTLVTEVEAEQGDLSPLLIREARGSFFVPHHSHEATPLGTQSVRAFRRPAWTFNKIVVIEKEDLRLMLEQAEWPQRHDAMLMSSKGFNTRAARDLIDAVAETTEPVSVFSAHDADAAGTRIQHALQHATLARAARKIEIIDLGLQPWEGIERGLQIEKVPVSLKKNGDPKRRAVGDYIKARTDRAPTGETWEDWLQHSRFELNAFSSAELIEWLDAKMAEHAAGKLIPPDDILIDGFEERLRERAETAVADAISARTNTRLAAIEAEQAKAVTPINAEIARLAAPFYAEIRRVTADAAQRLAATITPFEQQTATVLAEANGIDRERETARAIAASTPKAAELIVELEEGFEEDPSRLWSDALDDIADDTEIAAIKLEIDEGGRS